MEVISLFLFILPGFFLEYLYESIISRHSDYLYRFLRGLFFNVPVTIATWLVIWVYKLVLVHPMFKSFNHFIDLSLKDTTLLHYVLVLLSELVVSFVIFKIIKHKKH